jgi:hypothetical protein
MPRTGSFLSQGKSKQWSSDSQPLGRLKLYSGRKKKVQPVRMDDGGWKKSFNRPDAKRHSLAGDGMAWVIVPSFGPSARGYEIFALL